jgi:soluble lytic murein transglycosylase
LKELQYAQRAWGDTPAVQATIAWIRHEQGLDQRAMERFQNLRGAITLMKRAYPQYLAAGGEDLPPEVLRVMFPLDYWALVRKYAELNDLDPYLMAALIAQESTFTADIRSPANAYGLMQLIPAAGRQYARKVGLRYSLALLSQPEANIRMGMAYFKDLSKRFGGDHFALASYNAGPHRVARWLSERPAIAQDEFIDDIPFPETQNYVKRILGQAEDYRRLYGSGLLAPVARAPVPVAAAARPEAPAAARRAPAPKAPVRAPRRPTRR